MITKTDCMSILVKLEDTGINIDSYLKQLIWSQEVPYEVLKFIADHQGLEAIKFYEMLRKKHNQQKSPLYTNIIKEVAISNDTILTLSCLLTQVILYSKKLDDPTIFLKEVRAEEISRVLHVYFKTGSLDDSISLLKLIRLDLLVLEYVNGRRELES